MLIHELSSELNDVLNKISNIAEKNEFLGIVEECDAGKKELNEPLRMAIAGVISAGKSTLLNALMKRTLVPTAAETVTYHVNLLRHKNKNPDGKECVLAHKKDGSEECFPISFLSRLVDGREKDCAKLRTDISWLEVFIDNDTLNDLDIIDTPGLDSPIGEDTLNTIELFNDDKRRPDVLIYLMSKKALENGLEVIKKFQSKMSNGDASNLKINSLNTLLALTKCDEFCKDNTSADYTIDFHKKGMEIINDNIEKYAEFRLCFSKVFTLAAGCAESAYAMTESDFEIIKAISQCANLEDFVYLSNSPSSFINELDDFLSDSEVLKKLLSTRVSRESFLARMKLEIIKIAAVWLRDHSSCDKKQLVEHLISCSGVENMNAYIFSMFKRLAKYFKTMKIISCIRRRLRKLNAEYTTKEKRNAINLLLNLCFEFEKKLKLLFSYLNVLSDCFSGKNYFTTEEWNHVQETVDACLSDYKDDNQLKTLLESWMKIKRQYCLLCDVEAEESCDEMIRQLQLQLS